MIIAHDLEEGKLYQITIRSELVCTPSGWYLKDGNAMVTGARGETLERIHDIVTVESVCSEDHDDTKFTKGPGARCPECHTPLPTGLEQHFRTGDPVMTSDKRFEGQIGRIASGLDFSTFSHLVDFGDGVIAFPLSMLLKPEDAKLPFKVGDAVWVIDENMDHFDKYVLIVNINLDDAWPLYEVAIATDRYDVPCFEAKSLSYHRAEPPETVPVFWNNTWLIKRGSDWFPINDHDCTCPYGWGFIAESAVRAIRPTKESR